MFTLSNASGGSFFWNLQGNDLGPCSVDTHDKLPQSPVNKQSVIYSIDDKIKCFIIMYIFP